MEGVTSSIVGIFFMYPCMSTDLSSCNEITVCLQIINKSGSNNGFYAATHLPLHCGQLRRRCAHCLSTTDTKVWLLTMTMRKVSAVCTSDRVRLRNCAYYPSLTKCHDTLASTAVVGVRQSPRRPRWLGRTITIKD